MPTPFNLKFFLGSVLICLSQMRINYNKLLAHNTYELDDPIKMPIIIIPKIKDQSTPYDDFGSFGDKRCPRSRMRQPGNSYQTDGRPFTLLDEFFDPGKMVNLKLGKDGKPLLKNFQDIYNKTESVPYNHMTHVSKLFSLTPLPMGVMLTGIASIGNRTIKSLILEFREKELPKIIKTRSKGDFTVKSVAQRIIKIHYEVL